jgi:SAM-dependent methyltransferase
MESSKRDEALIREHNMSEESLARGEATGWFEPLYAAAHGDAEKVPWADEKPNPWLLEWLETQVPPKRGANAVVCGCGLGDDAEELARRGYDVVAFDISPTAIDWAKQRFPETSVQFRVGDLFELPSSMESAFDFVFEAYTLQALPVAVRGVAIGAVASLVAPGGDLLCVMRGTNADDPGGGPPWPMMRSEMVGMEAAGLIVDTWEEFMDGAIPRWRIHYLRPMV